MKKLINLVTTALVFGTLLPTTLASICFEHNNIFAPQQLTPSEDSDCWAETDALSSSLNHISKETSSSSSSSSSSPSSLNHISMDTSTSTDPITVHFTCQGASDSTCDKAQNAFKLATQRISTIINFVSPITVNASFLPICDIEPSICPTGYQVLGAAAPTKSFVLQDDDGVQRVYPQALTRQFTNLPSFFNFAEYDIQAKFNSEASFWFSEDEGSVPTTSTDFNYVVLHELFHGLGIVSAWQDYIGQGYLTPDPNLEQDENSNAYVFSGFLETAYDRFLYDPTAGQYLTLQTRQMDRYGMQVTEGQTDPDGVINDDDADDAASNLGDIDQDYEVTNRTAIAIPFPIDISVPATTIFQESYVSHLSHVSRKTTSRLRKYKASKDILLSSFRTSDRLTSLASEIGLRATSATLPPLIFAPLTSDNTTSALNQSFSIESGLSPFRPGSSLNHFDYKTYSTSGDNLTAEFLLTWLVNPGVSLQTLINASDNAQAKAPKTQDSYSLATVNSTGIGPGLVHMMASIGYKMNVPLPDVLLDFDRQLPPKTVKAKSGATSYQPFSPLVLGLLLLSIYLCK